MGKTGRGGWGMGTRVVHHPASQVPSRPVATPLYQSSTFQVEGAAAFDRAARPETRLFYVESPTNPTLRLVDLAAVGRIARRRGITLVVDNTFATPINQRPLDLGAPWWSTARRSTFRAIPTWSPAAW